MDIILYAIKGFELIKSAIEAGKSLKEVYDITQRVDDSVKEIKAAGRKPTPEEWDTMNAESEKLRSQRPTLD